MSQKIYESLRDILVDVFRYPKQIKGNFTWNVKKKHELLIGAFLDFKFDNDFAIRGLHYGRCQKVIFPTRVSHTHDANIYANIRCQ